MKKNIKHELALQTCISNIKIESKNKKQARINQLDIFELLIDINPIIKKGMKGVILDIYENGKSFEVEFVQSDGANIEYEGSSTFILNKEDIEVISN